MSQLGPGAEAESGGQEVSAGADWAKSAARGPLNRAGRGGAGPGAESPEEPEMAGPGRARRRRPRPVVLVLLLLHLRWPPVAGAAGARWSGPGTTPHLQSIFLGRCAEQIVLQNPELRDKNCTAIWEAFKVVLDKDPCSVRPSDYDLFINLSRHSIPRDKEELS